MSMNMNTLSILPTELWNKILNYKQRIEYDSRWGWRKEIELSKCIKLRDHQRWWVGNHRLTYFANWPDLDRAWFIYYLKYMKEGNDARRVLQMGPSMGTRHSMFRDRKCHRVFPQKQYNV